MIPTWDLVQQGLVGPEIALTDYFSQTIYGNGYVSAVEKVLSGEVEAAAVSDYVYKGDNKYLSDAQKAQLKIVQEQGPALTLFAYGLQCLRVTKSFCKILCLR